MNWILAFFGMYTANDLVLNMEENKSMHLWNQMLIWLIFRLYSSNTIKRYGLNEICTFNFPQRIKLNQFRIQITQDYSKINLVHIKLWRIFSQILLLNSVTCFFLYNTWFFFFIFEGQVGQSVGHQFVTRGVGSFDLVSFVTGTSSLKMEKVKYIRLE